MNNELDKVREIIGKESYQKLIDEGFKVIPAKELENLKIKLRMREKAVASVLKEKEVYDNFAKALVQVLEANDIHQTYDSDEE